MGEQNIMLYVLSFKKGVADLVFPSYNTSYTENEAPNIEFIGKTTNAQLPGHLNDSELFVNFVPTLELIGNTIRMNAISCMMNILLKKQLLQNLLTVNSAMMKSNRF